MRAIAYSIFFFAICLVGGFAHASCNYSSRTGPVKTPLMLAIWQGDIEAVGKMLSTEASLNSTFTYCGSEGPLKTTPLLNAILANSQPFDQVRHETHQKMVEFLLTHGASPDFSADGWAPLHMAASLGDRVTVKLLLRLGAPVDPVDRDNKTPLLVAVQDGSIAVAQELITAGADIHVHDSLGNNLVAIAASQHHEQILRLLVQLGIDPCAKDKDGNNASYWAGFGEGPEKQEIIAFLQEKCGR
jgi:ankyrin repeat protein